MRYLHKLLISILFIATFGFGQVDYQTQIQTIFNNNCTSCHINGGANYGGLDLSSYDSLMVGDSQNGPVVIAGDHASSLLWQKVNSGAMPPQNNPDLSTDEVSLIAQWIDEGASAYEGPVWHVATTGSDETGDGSEESPFATIQKGIDESIEGDTVLVAAGTYDGIFVATNINHRYILSSSGRDSTIILNTYDIMGSGAQDADSIFIDGFTFDDGQWGVAAFDCTNIYFSNIRITNIEQETEGPGGAVYSDGSTVFIDNIVIDNCISTYGAIITGVTEITNMTLVNSFQGGEYFIGSVADGSISNSIVWNNRYLYDNETVVGLNTNMFTFSNLEGYGGSNPLFCDPENSDFTLAENSPCVGTGEDGANMGAFGVGCGPMILEPVLAAIDDQQIDEDGSVTIGVSATSDMGLDMTFSVHSDTSDVVVSLDSTSLTATPSPDWFGSSEITIMVTDENELSDTTDFTLTVNAVNDAPEEFSIIYPTVSDTFSTHADNDSSIAFTWHPSVDVDSDISYKLTIELEFYGNIYTDIHENISDTTYSVSSNSLDPMLNADNQDEAVFTYYVHATDEEYTVSDTGEFVLSREALGIADELLPVVFALHQNYPNPFNPVTTLRYDLPENSLVNIIIYDLLGRQVKTLVNQTQDAGFKSVIWDATNDFGKPVSAGVYLYQIQAGEFVQTKKMVLLK